ncbi:MAG: M16 family metallopeptidase [Longimicrobiales bacterium]
MIPRSVVIPSLAAAALALAVPAAAQQAPPAPGAPKDFRLPETRAFSLDNGVGVTFVPFGTTPKALLHLVVHAGNADESADEVWLIDLTGDLMREGTTSRTAEQINREAAGMGGSLNVGVGPDEMAVGGEVLSEFAPEMVRLMADVVRNPAWPETELPRLKTDRARQLAIARSRPQAAAQERFLAMMFPEHPYGRLFPADDQLAAYTVDQVRELYARTVSPGRAHLYVVGRFDEAAVETAVTEALADWTGDAPITRTPPEPGSARMVHVIDRPGAVQSSIYLGLPVIDPTHDDWTRLEVTNTLLGGAFASRIVRNIREDKGYTYSPFSTVGTRFRTAYWAQVADVTTEFTGASLTEIFNEIERLRTEPPSEDELQGIKNYLTGTFTLRNASRGGLAATLQMVDLHGLPSTYLENYVSNVQAVTPEDVRRTAEQYLDPARMVIVVVGDREVIESQLESFGTIVN